jgi:hypothetical protein
MNNSTKADLSSSDLLSYITSTHIGDVSWKGSTQCSIVHWKTQLCLNESLLDPKEHFSGHLKCTMLQNAIHSVDELRSVRNQADQHKTKTGILLRYKQYVSLLLSAAVSYDATFKQHPSSK